MRYPKERATQTKLRIIRSAFWRFAVKGYEATSIDEVMRECDLTRGGFYAHFRSKSQLYDEAMSYGASQRASSRPALAHSDDWVEAVLCSKDIAASKTLARKVMEQVAEHASADEDATLAITALLVGAISIARCSDDSNLKAKLLVACKSAAKAMLEDKPETASALFWMPLRSGERL